MKDDDFFYIRYRNNLRKCLDYIINNPKLSRIIDPKVISQLKFNNSQLAVKAALKEFNISIGPFEINANELMNCKHFPEAHLSIGGEIQFNSNGDFFQAISLCVISKPNCDVTAENGFSLCKMDNGKSYIVRRFHFDIDAKQINGDRPVFHLQYGGNIHDKQKSSHQYELISSIDLPRIPTMPLDLIQALNLIFSQIKTQIMSVFKDPRWRSIVIENDKIWDDIYFSAILKRDEKQTLYERLCSHNVFS
ncbi:hypothetical protein [Pantoea sp. SM3]|uniref:hypothetical protein n=1 Tax=Pantoea sp. SM3 TaxID=1628192 RepID=UPI0005F78913|nr:hypothetical protein [Pantoea sp. SM3]KJV27308.1 hypothetical protein VI01_19655 [Pantoea sp. SM3]